MLLKAPLNYLKRKPRPRLTIEGDPKIMWAKSGKANVSKGQGANIQKISGLGSSGWIFIFPVIAMLAIFFLVPLAGVIYLSLTEWSLIGSPVFSGFSNYQEIFANQILSESTLLFFLFHQNLWTNVGLEISPIT